MKLTYLLIFAFVVSFTAALLASCEQGPTLNLERKQWVCTSEKYVVIHPPVLECVQYSKLR
jgi:hypothetical protein